MPPIVLTEPEPRVSIVVPLYGQAHLVTETIGSLMQSVWQNFVCVIVNDGDPDPASHEAGQALAAAYGSRVTYARQQNSGLSGARNRGISISLGRWPSVEAIFFLDSDNRILPTTLAHLVRQMDERTEIDVFLPHMRLFGEKHHTWQMVPELSAYRQLYENQAGRRRRPNQATSV